MADSVSPGPGESGSVSVTANDAGTPRVVDTSGARLTNAGGSFAGDTVKVKARCVVAVPSLTDSVMVVTPVAFGLGDSVTSRALPLPPSPMPAAFTSAVFDDVA